jgi:hypothetical protein
MLRALIAAASFAVATLCLAAPIYKWVDEHGVTNYGSAPPPGRKSVQLDEEATRVSTIEAYDYSRQVAASTDRSLRQRIDRLEEELSYSRQAAAAREAAAADAARQARELCIAQRRVDCDDPYLYFRDPGYVYAYPPFGRFPPHGFHPRPKPGVLPARSPGMTNPGAPRSAGARPVGRE